MTLLDVIKSEEEVLESCIKTYDALLGMDQTYDADKLTDVLSNFRVQVERTMAHCLAVREKLKCMIEP